MTQTYNYYYSSFLLLCILIVVILLESCLPAKQEECMRKVNFNECDDERKTFFWQNFWLGRISRRFVSAKEMIATYYYYRRKKDFFATCTIVFTSKRQE